MNDNKIVSVLCALGNSYRIEIIRHLMVNNELNVKGVTERLEFLCEQSLVSKHLKILKEAGILKSRSKGTNVFYSISTVISMDLEDAFCAIKHLARNLDYELKER